MALLPRLTLEFVGDSVIIARGQVSAGSPLCSRGSCATLILMGQDVNHLRPNSISALGGLLLLLPASPWF